MMILGVAPQKVACLRLMALVILTAVGGLPSLAVGAEPKLTLKRTETSLEISVGNQPVGTYIFADEKVARPFYAHVFALSGNPVTRTFPPKAGEPSDHADMHPGIWLAFGDLSGHDFWRNKGRVKHAAFLAEPKAEGNQATFTVRNEYLASSATGEKTIGTEVCRHTWLLQEGGILLTLDSELASADPDRPLVFGDQEEMGLGVRVATALRVKDAGGSILTSEGKRNEKEAWGKTARWCDYSGVVDGRRVGITLMAHPDNFRESWFHVRDYGLMVANPFGQNAFTGKEKGRLEIKPGEKLRLRFGVWIHSGKEKRDLERENAYKTFVKLADQPFTSAGSSTP